MYKQRESESISDCVIHDAFCALDRNISTIEELAKTKITIK